jgi:hypothetical protein
VSALPDPSRLYLIYSREHNAWWRPGERGYTLELDEAGRYTALEVRRICYSANRRPGPDGGPNEFHVPAHEALLEAFQCGVIAGASSPSPPTMDTALRVLSFTFNLVADLADAETRKKA